MKLGNKKLVNPFIYQGYESPEYFCDREAETATLLSHLKNGRNVTLISPRRIGKTGLIKNAFFYLEEEENDTVCLTELMFTDNDELSGLIAKMLKADALVLLSNVDGIYNGDPSLPTSRIIPSVYYDRDVSEYVSEEKSSHGRGGMISKLKTAQDVANAGIKVIIANGNTPNILIDLKEHPMETLHTEFAPRPQI